MYRLCDKQGRLLYVGIAYDPDARWAQHAAVTRWWRDVADKYVEWYETRAEAERAEIVAIRYERPIYNKRDSPKPYKGSTAKRGLALPRRISIKDEIWETYQVVCAEEGLTVDEDITRHIKRQLRAHRAEERRHKTELRRLTSTDD
ncbi:GIY-YIG nuclease family protein [Streptomyces nigrescens]